MYDPDKEQFPVSISSISPTVKLSVEGTLSLPRDKAKQFKQWYTTGLVSPEAIMKTGSSTPVRVAMVNDGVKNDSDEYLLELYKGVFVTVTEKKRRSLIDDPSLGVIWALNGNIAGKQMNWQEAMDWVKSLNYLGYSDWRLPTKVELKAFANRSGNRPSEWFNANGFNNIQSSWYWSSDYESSGGFYKNSKFAWHLDMDDGRIDQGSIYTDNYVWPVRDAE